MYRNYWGYGRVPFGNVPDTDFFYMSKNHAEGLSRLSYAVEYGKGCGLLVGDIGVGKTTLGKVFLENTVRDNYHIVFIDNPCLYPTEFLQDVLLKLNVFDIPDTKVKILHILREKLIRNLEQNNGTVLLIDEAQLLGTDTLEEVRLLLNLHHAGRFLLTVVLLGQKEVVEKIENLKPFQQRVAVKYTLSPFDRVETEKYILIRQKRAGARRNVFTRQAIHAVYQLSGGIPRVINHLCDLSLLVGADQGAEQITSDIVKGIFDDQTIFLAAENRPGSLPTG